MPPSGIAQWVSEALCDADAAYTAAAWLALVAIGLWAFGFFWEFDRLDAMTP